MKITEAGDRMVIADTPGCLWLFGLAFVTSGLIVLSIPFASQAWTTFVLWERAAVLAIGAAHFTAGVWLVRRHAATRTELDRSSGAGVHRVRKPGALAAVVTRFDLGDIRAVEIRQDKDSDGDPMYQLRLWLSGSRVLPLQSQPAHGEQSATVSVELIRGFLGLRADP